MIRASYTSLHHPQNNLTDVSKSGSPAYDLSGPERWRFVQFGEYVIAAGGTGEELQKWQLGTDTAFANLAGSPPNADFIAVVRDFIWVGNIDEGSGRVPYRVRWSGFNDIDGWTTGTDQSDFQDLPDSGAITGLVGGEYCTILCERAIFRATYTGPPLIWQFDRVESQVGCRLPGSVCNYGSLTFFLADNGFHAFDGQKATPIGNSKIDKFFEKDFNAAHKDNVSAAVDPLNQIAVWAYPSVDSANGDCDKLLIYNYALNRWSTAEQTTNLIAPFFSGGYTLDNLDNISATLDGLTTVLDSQLFRGGEYFFGAAIDTKLATFTGDPLAATLETGEVGIATGQARYCDPHISLFRGRLSHYGSGHQKHTHISGYLYKPGCDERGRVLSVPGAGPLPPHSHELDRELVKRAGARRGR